MRLAPRITRPAPARMEKPGPFRSKAHIDFIHGLMICAATGWVGPVDAHHLLHLERPDGSVDIRGSRKRGDDLTVPLRHEVHMAAHASGRPEEYLLKHYGISCHELSQALMRVSGDHEAGLRVIERARQDSALKRRSLLNL